MLVQLSLLKATKARLGKRFSVTLYRKDEIQANGYDSSTLPSGGGGREGEEGGWREGKGGGRGKG
jgi:hypothetical protein